MEPEVKLTEKIYSFLKEQCHQMPQNSKETKEIHKFIEKEPQPSSIPFRIVRYAFTEHKNTGKKKVYLNELLEGSDLHLPEIIPPPRNLELEARIQKLKLEQQNKIYKDITRNVSIEQDKPDESIQHDSNDDGFDSWNNSVFCRLIFLGEIFKLMNVFVNSN
ncbi:hypothetical protein KUTeg_009661 [Tegillarca granosa]|uniref:Uncharacterized protein n=1 Tax=Tegillarca granosa TaxID=220873 RepID=A0ABQ9F4J1_TEGGR|nr:hypothetical protein KUTeg_009661 [Tegillarca granosa]